MFRIVTEHIIKAGDASAEILSFMDINVVGFVLAVFVFKLQRYQEVGSSAGPCCHLDASCLLANWFSN